MARIDYWNDSHAPQANSLIPADSAIVTDDQGNILLHRRTDNDLWALPGGAMNIGERIGDTVVREVKEETGLDVTPEYIIGIYTNPNHVIAFSDGEEITSPVSVLPPASWPGSFRRVPSAPLAFSRSTKYTARLVPGRGCAVGAGVRDRSDDPGGGL